MTQKKVLLLLGPNLNMVGIREKGVYGQETAAEVERQAVGYANSLGFACDVFQSNYEGALIDKIRFTSHGNGMMVWFSMRAP